MNDLSEEHDARMRRLQDDHDALQDEMAGHGFSRQSRIGRTREEIAERRSGRSASGMSDFTSQLQMLLANDPEYRAAYERTWDVLTDAETRAQSTIDALEAQLERDEAALEALTRSAASLPDGTKVFRAADGSLKTQEGTDVSHLSDHVVWRGDEPSWEDYRDQQARTENLRGDLDAWRYYQVETLGHARDRLSDEDNPPSVEELDEIQRDIEAKMPQAPEPTEPAEAADIAVSPAAKIEIPAI